MRLTCERWVFWNLNFSPVAGAEDEKAACSILYPDWAPRQAHAAVHDMPK
ncbi:MAG: hypothetical protein H8E90_06610 [Anaerolineales bacterium]|nr:hypothetical protein [Anaerolineales bacterium]